uniref:Uncharacterized protein n=1 Tax=Rhizophora mucronata TaxID=61149 RepID=A0A2P2P8K0_RHIMU
MCVMVMWLFSVSDRVKIFDLLFVSPVPKFY